MSPFFIRSADHFSRASRRTTEELRGKLAAILAKGTSFHPLPTAVETGAIGLPLQRRVIRHPREIAPHHGSCRPPVELLRRWPGGSGDHLEDHQLRAADLAEFLGRSERALALGELSVELVVVERQRLAAEKLSATLRFLMAPPRM